MLSHLLDARVDDDDDDGSDEGDLEPEDTAGFFDDEDDEDEDDDDDDEAPWLGEPEGGSLLSPQAQMNSTRHHPEAYLFITPHLAQPAPVVHGKPAASVREKSPMAMPGRHAPEQNRCRCSSGKTA